PRRPGLPWQCNTMAPGGRTVPRGTASCSPRDSGGTIPAASPAISRPARILLLARSTMACAPPPHDPEDDTEPPPDSPFESYYDEESGTWSLRRVPSAPPPDQPAS